MKKKFSNVPCTQIDEFECLFCAISVQPLIHCRSLPLNSQKPALEVLNHKNHKKYFLFVLNKSAPKIFERNTTFKYLNCLFKKMTPHQSKKILSKTHLTILVFFVFLKINLKCSQWKWVGCCYWNQGGLYCTQP